MLCFTDVLCDVLFYLLLYCYYLTRVLDIDEVITVWILNQGLKNYERSYCECKLGMLTYIFYQYKQHIKIYRNVYII